MSETTPPAKKPAAKKSPAAKPAAAPKAAVSKAATPKSTAPKAAPKPAAKKPAAAASAAEASAAPAPAAPPLPPPPAYPTPAPAGSSTPPPAAASVPPAAPSLPPVAVQPMLESEARTMSTLIHVLGAVGLFISAGTLAFVAPLVIWLMYRERSALVDQHGRTALNLQITTAIIVFAGYVLGFITFGFGFILTLPVMLGYGLYAFIIGIVAGVRANRGEYYRIPAAFRFFREPRR